ncbi:unnamed protein product [Paramecium pentaurelia]|uniref:Tetrahydrofolate dehydrogenase/cyclohydrolase NAD(P)-binding domain-containing protein n=1 Tax=Paramecium pentaurelia TaxID=43138 RepID=A0A8S1W3H9_9CILI|nr:unnamed protein product [Paramecium pentaurelia]
MNTTISSCILRLAEQLLFSVLNLSQQALRSASLPLSVLLLRRNAKVTICHSETTVQEHVEKADIVISCAGHKELVKGEWIKNGAKVIDVGITRIPGTNKIVGDIEFHKALTKVSFITPVPGGVGPLTVSMLFKNLYRVWCRSNGLQLNIDEQDEELDYAQNYQF